MEKTKKPMDKASNPSAANRAVIKQRWPDILKQMEEASIPEKTLFTKYTPEPTLFINGIHLSSGYDQIREAELQASLVPEDSPCAWIYGVGPGQIPRVLLRRKKIKRVVVVIMNSGVAMQSFFYFDHTDWLSDLRVKLVLAEYEPDIHFPFAAAPSCLELASDSAARLRDMVFLELSTPFIREGQNARNIEMADRLQENLKFVHSDGDVADLFDSKQETTILVAAAGPTLSDNYEWIADQRRKYPLIAVDAALKPLVETGIHPDIVVTIDAIRDGVYSFFNSVEAGILENIILVYFPVVHKDVLSLWPGRRFAAYPDHTIYKRLIKEHPRGILFSSGSVLHPAVDLAVRMGACRVILLGADFSYPKDHSHVAGCPAFMNMNGKGGTCSHWVLNGHGKRVATSANLRGYLRDLERYIARYPKLHFVNGSKDGACIKGASYLEKW